MSPVGDDRDESWEAAGQAIISRRVELGMRTRQVFAEKSQLSVKTLGELERGDRTSYDPATLAAVEQALEWPAGHIRWIVGSFRLGAMFDGSRGSRSSEVPDDGAPPRLLHPFAVELDRLLAPDSLLTADEREALEFLAESVLRRFTEDVRQRRRKR